MSIPWSIPEIWNNSKVFIIGGGTSLETMDWSSFQKEKECRNFKVLGCNDAYQLGDRLVDVCVFGDGQWYWKHKEQLQAFNNLIVTNDNDSPALMHEERLKICKRESLGFNMNYDNRLAWYMNTGITAIELAYRLGSRKIVLLGYDMYLNEEGEQNWHPNELCEPDMKRFNKFIRGAKRLVGRMRQEGLTAEIYNANPLSGLDTFEKVSYQDSLEL